MPLHHLAKLLLSQSTQKEGMLIRLLVLGGLSGLGASIASSSAYSQQYLVRSFEARRYIGIINYAQKSYYQTNQRFASQLEQLKTGFSGLTNYYTYVVAPTHVPGSTFTAVTAQARPLPNRPYLKAVIGGTLALPTSSTTLTLVSKRCEATLPPAQGGPNGDEFINVSSAGGLDCPKGYQELKGR
jgi:type II secretory pathway pseudopilin PulG